MPESNAPVRPGQRLNIAAADWNRVRRLADSAGVTDAPGAGEPGRGVNPGLTVLVRNDTGDDLPALAVLTIAAGTPPVDPAEVPEEFRREPVFAGAEPGGPDDVPLVLVEAVPDGEYGRATITGVTTVKVAAGTARGDRVGCVAGETGHLGGDGATALVLWVGPADAEDEEAPVWGVVLLGAGGATDGGGPGDPTGWCVPTTTYSFAFACDEESGLTVTVTPTTTLTPAEACPEPGG